MPRESRLRRPDPRATPPELTPAHTRAPAAPPAPHHRWPTSGRSAARLLRLALLDLSTAVSSALSWDSAYRRPGRSNSGWVTRSRSGGQTSTGPTGVSPSPASTTQARSRSRRAARPATSVCRPGWTRCSRGRSAHGWTRRTSRPGCSNRVPSRRGGRLADVAHVPPHGRDDAVPQRLERPAGVAPGARRAGCPCGRTSTCSMTTFPSRTYSTQSSTRVSVPHSGQCATPSAVTWTRRSPGAFPSGSTTAGRSSERLKLPGLG